MADSIKINKLEIENVKRIKAVKIEPTKNGLTIVGGNNNQGKTSVLDSIAWALGGDRYKPSEATRNGSVVPPNLHIVMSNGLVVERKGKNSSLKVTDPNGNKGGQQLLNDFVEQLALDLPKFMESSGKEKAQTLLKIIGVGDKLTALEQQEKEPQTGNRSESEEREMRSRGGKRSGETRRRKAALRDTMNRLLTMQVEVDGLSDILRSDGGESTYEEVIAMAMIQQASLGDVKAYQAIMKTVGQTEMSEADLEEQKIRTDRAKRARDQEIGDTDNQDENIRDFLKAMRPTQEDLDNLFDDEEEEEEDAEAEEETGEV